MKIDQLDTNFRVESDIKREGLAWHDVRRAPFALYGLCREQEPGPFHRIPTVVARATSPGVEALNYQTAGGRVRFSTDSPYIAIHCVYANAPYIMGHMPFCGSQGFDLYRDGESGISRYCKTFIPPVDLHRGGFDGIAEVGDGGMRSYTLNFPLYGGVAELYIGLADHSTLGPGLAYANSLPAVFYGSSITQGGCASRPGTCYQAHLSRRFSLDYINLGFSGNARGEEAIADYIAGLPMSCFVCDYDHNAPTPEHLAATLPRLYEKVRAAHTEIPILLVSRPDFSESDDCLRRRDIVYGVYRRARLENGDRRVRFVDGARLFLGDCRGECTVDGIHPNDLGFYRMYLALAEVMQEFL